MLPRYMQSGRQCSTSPVFLPLALLVMVLAFGACQMPIQVQSESAAGAAAGAAAPAAAAAKAAVQSAASPVSGTLETLDQPTDTVTPAPTREAPLAGPDADRTGAPEPTMTPLPENAPTYTPVPTVAPTATPVPEVTPATVLPDRILAPAIGLDAPVVEVKYAMNAQTGLTEWQTADFAAGFHHGSALPGAAGNTVISGHHNINGKVFANLYKLKPQDEVDLRAGGMIYRYQVEDSFVVPERGVSEEQREQNARWIAPTRDVRLTLVTCWPPNDNSHRVIVIARLVGEQAATAAAAAAAAQ
jgi:sortase A